MAARPRRPVLALLAASAVALLAGCGTTFKLPTENRVNPVIPGQGTYQRIATWTGMTNIQDILLTPSGELFLLFQDPAGGGEVRRYPQSNPTPISAPLPGLINPVAICFGNNRIFVLDQGDTTAARSTVASPYAAEFTPDDDVIVVPMEGFQRPITNLAVYWRVHEYLLDGTPVSTFSDTSMAWVNGIAADASGRVYVSGTLMFCRVDPFNERIRTLEYRYRIRRYEHGTGDRFVTDGAWRRDPTYWLVEGTGFGSTRDPRGMQWASPQGAALYFADLGNNQVQRYGDPAGGAGSFKLDIGGAGADSMLLSLPTDVAVDSAGFVYVVDTGNLRVLRYDPDGAFFQRVDRNPDDITPPLARPVAAAADNRQVYIADRGAGQVLRYWRRD